MDNVFSKKQITSNFRKIRRTEKMIDVSIEDICEECKLEFRKSSF